MLDEIKSKIDIVDLIGSYIHLKKAGASYKAVCPFHSEKTPSFFVSPQRQIWHCFGCSEGGDIFKFVMKQHNVDFPEALKILAQRAGIELRKEDPKLKSEKLKLYNICIKAVRFFKLQLVKHPPAVNYLRKRGLKDETIKTFHLGYAPEGDSLLTKFLINSGYNQEDVELAGLLIKKEDGSYIERFRSRIMFPIFDIQGRPVGFTGRSFPEYPDSLAPKYHNSPETLIFKKGSILYGLNKTKDDIKKEKSAVLVEGQMDFLLAWQNGLRNIVAESGTALTPEQIKIIRRFANTIYFAYDNDEAGELALARSAVLTLGENLKAFKIEIPQGKDLADFALTHPEKVREIKANSLSLIDYFFKQAYQEFDLKKPEEVEEFVLYILDKIKLAPDLIQGIWLKRLSEESGINGRLLLNTLEKIRAQEYINLPKPIQEIAVPEAVLSFSSRHKLLSQKVLAVIIKLRNLIALEEIKEFLDEENAALTGPIKNYLAENKEPDELKPEFDYIYLLADYFFEKTDDFRKELEILNKELKKEFYRREIKKLQNEISQIENQKLSVPQGILNTLQSQLSKYKDLM